MGGVRPGSNEVTGTVAVVGFGPFGAEGQHLRRQFNIIELTSFVGEGVVKLGGGVSKFTVQYRRE